MKAIGCHFTFVELHIFFISFYRQFWSKFILIINLCTVALEKKFTSVINFIIIRIIQSFATVLLF